MRKKQKQTKNKKVQIIYIVFIKENCLCLSVKLTIYILYFVNQLDVTRCDVIKLENQIKPLSVVAF